MKFPELFYNLKYKPLLSSFILCFFSTLVFAQDDCLVEAINPIDTSQNICPGQPIVNIIIRKEATSFVVQGLSGTGLNFSINGDILTISGTPTVPEIHYKVEGNCISFRELEEEITGTILINTEINGPNDLCLGDSYDFTVDCPSPSGVWDAEDPMIASVNHEGVVTAIGEGTADIYYHNDDEEISYVIEVTVHPKPTITGTDSVCVGQETQMTVNDELENFFWYSTNPAIASVENSNSLGQIGGRVTGNSQGAAYIIFENDFCSDSILITVGNVPDAQAWSVPDTLVCVGNNLFLYSSGGTYYSWEGPQNYFSNSQNNIIPNVNSDQSGTYTVTVKNPGCSEEDTAPVNIYVPYLVIGGNNELCPNDTVQLYVNETGGTWASDSLHIAMVNNTGIVTGISGGQAIISYTSINHGCVAYYTITVNPKPTVSIQASPNPACTGDSLFLMSGDGDDYSWVGPNGFTSDLQNPILDSIQHEDEGSYSVTITNSYGCINTDSIHIVVGHLPDAGDDIHVHCWFRDTAFLAASDSGVWTLAYTLPDSLELTFSDSSHAHTQVFDFSDAGQYVLIWTTPIGCTDTLILNVDSLCNCDFVPEINLSLSNLLFCDTGIVQVDNNSFINADSIYSVTNGSGALEINIDTSSFSFSYQIAPEDVGDTIIITFFTNDPDSIGACPVDTAFFTMIVGTAAYAGADTSLACWLRDTAYVSASGQGSWHLTGTEPDSLNCFISEPDSNVTSVNNFTGKGLYHLIWTNEIGCSDTLTIETDEDCPCISLPTITLYSIDTALCFIQPVIVSENLYFNASQLFINHSGNGNASIINKTDSTFRFLYEPALSDSGNVIILTLYTNDPDSLYACLADTVHYSIYYNPADAGNDFNAECWKNAILPLNAAGQGEWTLLSTFPTGLTFSSTNLSDPNNILSEFSGPGLYNLRWTNNSGCMDDIVIQVGEDCPCEIDANISQIHTTCGFKNGQLKITLINAKPPIQYTINGPTPISSVSNQLIFDVVELAAGNYILNFVDGDGCELSALIVINGSSSPSIDSLSIDDIICNDLSGGVSMFASNGSGTLFFNIDGGIFSPNNIFVDLAEGNHIGQVRDSLGCMDTIEFQIKRFLSPTIIFNSILHTTCGNSNGVITGNVEVEEIPFNFTLNGIELDPDFTLNNLASGAYTFEILDSLGCSAVQTVTINSSVPASFSYNILGFNCTEPSGTIIFTNQEGAFPFQFSVNGNSFTSNSVFENLTFGEYILEMIDANNCLAMLNADITLEKNFEAINDTISWHFQYSPLVLSPINNDLIANKTDYFVRPSTTIVYDNDSENIGTIFQQKSDSLIFEFYFDGIRKNIYPERLIIPYLLCEIDCPTNCDTADIIILPEYNCIDGEGEFVNIITPNGDGVNDELIIPKFPKCQINYSEFSVFNRWGGQVFSSINYENIWDGRGQNGAHLPSGTYYYILKFYTEDNKQFIIKNFVEIIR